MLTVIKLILIALTEIYMLCIVTPPPIDVQATQSNFSAPLEISWSPPFDGSAAITRYRIFYGNGNVSVPSVATSIGLRVNRSYLGQFVSIRSESDHLYSEPIIASVTVG